MNGSADPVRMEALIRELRGAMAEQGQRFKQSQAEVALLKRQNAELRAQLAERDVRIAALERKLDQARQEAARQAAPFRVPEKRRKAKPGRPGRKVGHAGVCRAVPDHVDEEIVVPLQRCPRCGGPVRDVQKVEQYIEDLPPLGVHVTRLVTHVGRCARCGRVRSVEPRQMSQAQGCAKVQLGARALGLAAEMKHGLGIPYRKIARLLASLGMKVTAGALAQGMRRAAGRLREVYEGIGESIRAGPVVHADETSWYVGEPGWWLWVFCRPDATYYVVERGRGSAVVDAVLGPDYGGTLVSDCLSSYDVIECRKSKCMSHHLKALSKAQQDWADRDEGVLEELKVKLRTVIWLSRARSEMTPEQFAQGAAHLAGSINALLDEHGGGPLQKPLHRFVKHRAHLLRCLEDPRVEPTNNLAERQLRPAVVARKVSCGNRTERGTESWQALTSVAATCRQRGVSFAELVARAMPISAPTPSLLTAAG